MKALVTGGAGLIGSHLVDLLLIEKWQVRILDNLEPTTHPFGRPDWIPNEAEFQLGDVRNPDDLDKALAGVDVIFHQAAFGGFVPEVSKYLDTNAVGTARIFEAIVRRAFDIQKIVVASSQAVYGEAKYSCPEHGTQYPSIRAIEQLMKAEWETKCPVCGAPLTPLPTDEVTPLDPTTPYAISKLAEEKLAINLGRELGIPAVALRYSLTYGPRQSLFNPYTGICSIFSTRLLNDLPPIVFEDGNQTRDFIFVEDVAKANLHVYQSQQADYEVFNVGTQKNTSVNAFVDVLSGAYEKSIRPSIKGEFRPGEVRHLFADKSKIKAIGFNNKTILDEGIRAYASWILQQGSVEEYFSRAEKNMRTTGLIRQTSNMMTAK